MKKKYIAFLLTLTTALASASYAGAAPLSASENLSEETATEAFTEEPNEMLLGGWTISEDEEIPEEASEAFSKALEGLEGAVYEPVKLLASQVVAGTNYAFLCTVTPVYPNAQPSYDLVYVYADLEGNAELMGGQELFTPSEEEDSTGGEYTILSDEIAADAESALRKATEELVGAVYESVAPMGYQPVAGTYYMLLCKVTPVVPDAESSYCKVTVFEDLDGEAEIVSADDILFSLPE